jgi:DNA-binding MarR family transcriptional regulator
MPADAPSFDRPAELEAQLAGLPPSAKYVYMILRYEGTLTQQELQEATLLPRRTVSHALAKLKEVDLVEKRVHGCDARVREYSARPECG